MGSSKSKEKVRASDSSSSVIPDDPEGRRMSIAQEVLQSERSYVNSLTTCQHVWLDPLAGNKKLLKPAEHAKIFSNLMDIITVQQGFLNDLEATLEEPAPRIGSTILKHAENFKCYSVYINNYYEAINTLISCQEKRKQFVEFNAQAMDLPETQGLSLPSYLIMPVQRLPRYVLLLEDLSKHTDKKHVDYKPGLQALDLIREVADYVNEEKRIVENMQEVMQIQSCINGQPNLVDRDRYFVKEGDFNAGEKKKEPRPHHYYLFNDMLIICTASGTSRMMSTLQIFRLAEGKTTWKALDSCLLLKTEVTDCKDKHDMTNYIELSAEKQWTIFFDSREEKQDWVDRYYATRARAPAKRK